MHCKLQKNVSSTLHQYVFANWIDDQYTCKLALLFDCNANLKKTNERNLALSNLL